MALEVEELRGTDHGAHRPDRFNHRNGYRNPLLGTPGRRVEPSAYCTVQFANVISGCEPTLVRPFISQMIVPPLPGLRHRMSAWSLPS